MDNTPDLEGRKERGMTWQLIKTAPKDGSRILLARHGLNEWLTFGTYCTCNSSWMGDDGDTFIHQPTYWMEQPSMPRRKP